jgi:ABC-type transporter Mla MlaB component
MLKIERTANGVAIFFRLSGRIGADELTELESTIKSETENKHMVLDLKDVTLVDLNAVKSLDRYEMAKVELINAPAYIRTWIETERAARPEPGEVSMSRKNHVTGGTQ